MSGQGLLYFSGEDVRRALPMPEAIAAMRDAFRCLADGQVTMPPRTRLEAPQTNGLLLMMPCYSAGVQRLSLKVLTQFSHNRALGLPLIQALVILADANDGRPLAIMDGSALTAIRTGAASGLATDLLARPEATAAGIFGAGAQARTQLEAVCAVRPIRRARVYDADAASAERFAGEMSARLGIPVERALRPDQALEGALIICTATTSPRPVFEDADLAAGAHINGVGSWKPDIAEIPAATVRRARVVVDQREAALEEAGDLLMPLRAGLISLDHFQAELGEVLTGRAPGRQSDAEVTFFKSVGLAVEDLFAAQRALENARRLKVGIELPR